jgi:hypothetical protein
VCGGVWLYAKVGCGACRKVQTLGTEAKMGMNISKDWANNKIIHFWYNTRTAANSL